MRYEYVVRILPDAEDTCAAWEEWLTSMGDRGYRLAHIEDAGTGTLFIVERSQEV